MVKRPDATALHRTERVGWAVYRRRNGLAIDPVPPKDLARRAPDA